MSDEAAKKSALPERRSFPKGTTIFKEADKADTAYILESGKVEIFKVIGGRRIRLGNVPPWGIFGELGILVDGPRMGTAYAVQDSVCVVLTKDSITQMLDEAPQGLTVLIRSLVQTIRTAGDDLAEARFLLMEHEKAQ
jgi:CRP-like cAMP-binding protein